MMKTSQAEVFFLSRAQSTDFWVKIKIASASVALASFVAASTNEKKADWLFLDLLMGSLVREPNGELQFDQRDQTGS